jgi:PEP-CTERM motif
MRTEIFEPFAAFNFIAEETITVPRGINDFGEITGYQFESLGGTRSFVATPVPEAGTLGLVGTGLMVIAGAVRRRSSGFTSHGVPPIVP